jgi:hypothetical protein
MIGMVLGGLALLVVAGVAHAVSGGGYAPSQQDCPANASASNTPKCRTVQGCHNFDVIIEDSHGRRFVEVGIDQLPRGYPRTPGLFGLGYPGSPNSPHSGCVAVNTNGTDGGPGRGCGNNPHGTGASVVFDLQHPNRNAVAVDTGAPDINALAQSIAGGLQGYVGADDNLDAGEHDGVTGANGTSGSVNGPSDGGAIHVHVTPGAATTAPSLADPVPLAGASEGFCADGYCQEVTTERQVVYRGNPHSKRSRDVADYSGKGWDPYDCSSGDAKAEKACKSGSHHGMDDWRNSEVNTVYAEPGVQVYEDPDPQASPLDPLYEAHLTPRPMLYPIPAAYVGTCGVVAGGGPLASAPAGTPLTNSAGQVVVSTGC